MSDEGSVDFAADESLHLAPLASTNAKNHKKQLFMSANPHQLPTRNQCLPVLAINKDNSKPAVNESFEDYLTEDDSNLDAVIVSILGPRRIGKSFLLDSLLTVDNGKVTRLMSKNSKPFVNSPAHLSKTRNGDRIIYFDSEGEPTSQIFLWNYFLSSIMVYNLSPNDKNEQANFIDHLSFVQSHLDSQIDDLSPPQLIVIRRDAGSKEINDKDLMRKVQEYGLFSDIQVIHMPFPGNNDVKAKQLLDVPLREIESKYQNEVERLLQKIKTGKTKIIRGNYLSTKILSLILEPLTKGLNSNHRVSTNKVWDDVVETLSIGFYNFYLKSYSQELEKQFHNQKPCDKYTVYKRLNKLKRNVNKKVEGFKNISDDPIFVGYKNKLEETIKNKENLVKEVNRAKSRAANDNYCKKLLSQLNEKNCPELIDEYCKSELDDEKTEVLLQNFEVIIRQKAKVSELAKNPGKKTTIEIMELQKQLARIEREIEVASRPQDATDYTGQITKMQRETQQKERQLKQLEAELADLRNASQVMSKGGKADKELQELQAECERLNENIVDCDKEIVNLRKKREQKMRESVGLLEKEFKKVEEERRKQDERLQSLQQIKTKYKAETGKKDTCCSLM